MGGGPGRLLGIGSARQFLQSVLEVVDGSLRLTPVITCESDRDMTLGARLRETGDHVFDPDRDYVAALGA